MKRILALLLIASQVHAAINGTTVWFVDPLSGSDLNSGAFDAAAGGTNRAIQTSPQVTFDGSTITATGLASTTLTLTGVTADATWVGNYIRIASGTGTWLPGVYRVTAQASTSVTLDRNPATGVSSAMVGRMGGALSTTFDLFGSTVSVSTGVPVNQNIVYIKNDATMVISSSQTISYGSGGNVTLSRIVGYNTTPGDGGDVTIQMNSTYTAPPVAILCGGISQSFENIIIDCNSVASSTGVFQSVVGNQRTRFVNGGIKNCLGDGFAATTAGGTILMANDEFSGMGPAAAAVHMTADASVDAVGNWFHDNLGPAIVSNDAARTQSIIGNVFSNNTGVGFDSINPLGDIVYGNSFYNNTGISIKKHQAGFDSTQWIRNNLFQSTTTTSLQCENAAGGPADPSNDGNFYYGAGASDRLNCDDTTTSKQNGLFPYTRVLDSTGTANAFVNVGANNYSLNNIQGGGNAAKYKGTPSAFPNNTATTGYPDMGAVQSKPQFGLGN